METPATEPSTIDAYIESSPDHVRARLRVVRAAISAAAPDATEKISYRMPTFYLNGNLVHFAAFKEHIGFYPAPSGIIAFQDELAKYRWAKGSVRFPHDEPLPVELITRIVEHRVAENSGKKVRRGKRKESATE
jgi:uncharacterized protein YdhG (YjbR/CyaY superfamily)